MSQSGSFELPQYKVNPWVIFFRKYGPVPRNDNMYDESIHRSIRRTNVAPIAFESPRLSDLLNNFRSQSAFSVILTGTAGDGKTYLCRNVWQQLGGDAQVWDSDVKLRELVLPNGQRLVVIKDLSELKDGDKDVLVDMAEVLTGQRTDPLYLVAANDGQLVEAFAALPDSDATLLSRSIIEDLLVSGTTSKDGVPLKLYNLSRTSAATVLGQIIDAVVAHEGWIGCTGCRGQLEGIENRCPIWENRERLTTVLLRDRLRALLELCDHNEFHLPIRQLLLLVSNIILGNPGSRDGLMRCQDVPSIVAQRESQSASPYRNAFGGNLTASRRDGLEVFEVLGRFGVGEETSNRIDNVLIYGSDDDTLRTTFDALVRSDQLYGASDRFTHLQSAYLEGLDADASSQFLEAVASQRQRLFFTLPSDQAISLRLWDLTVFHFAGEYLVEVLAQLRSHHAAPRHIVGRLARGINRVFTGMLTTTDRQLVLATSGSYSQARVSRIEEAFLSIEPRRGERTVLELVNDRVTLAVYLDRDTAVRLPLHLVRYEFLSRVAEGALPSSFSKECYEDLLAFKSKLLREYRRVVDQYGERPSDDQLQLKLIQLDTRGAISSRPLEVRFDEGGTHAE